MALLKSGTRIYGNLQVDTWANIGANVSIGSNLTVGGNLLVSNSGILWSANGQPYSSGGGGGSYTGGVVTSNVYPSGNLTTNLGGTSN